MLVKGNTKLGAVWNWSTPAILTCVGSTALCRKLCYACTGAYRFQIVQARYKRNLAFSKTKHFVSGLISQIQQRGIAVVRIHASGDFDTVAYVRRWRMIIESCPGTQFYAYTRSWRRTGRTPAGLIPAIRELSRLPNVRLWLSCDRETGKPPAWSGCPTAWLMTGDSDLPPFPVDLAFRDNPTTEMRVVAGVAQVCPYEMHSPALMSRPGRTADENTMVYPVTCSKCRLCFDSKRKLLREFDRRPATVKRRKVRVSR